MADNKVIQGMDELKKRTSKMREDAQAQKAAISEAAKNPVVEDSKKEIERRGVPNVVDNMTRGVVEHNAYALLVLDTGHIVIEEIRSRRAASLDKWLENEWKAQVIANGYNKDHVVKMALFLSLKDAEKARKELKEALNKNALDSKGKK